MGLTPDIPLAFLFTRSRTMRFFDGPNEAHLRVLASLGWTPTAPVGLKQTLFRKRGQGLPVDINQGASETSVFCFEDSHCNYQRQTILDTCKATD